MIFVPLPFVVTLLIVVFLIQVVKHTRFRPPETLFFVLLLGAFALQSVFLGLRWGYGMTAVLPFQATLAALIAALSWLAFKSLTVENLLRRPGAVWPHLLPALLVIAELVFLPDLIGATLIATFLGYGAALGWIAWRGPDALLSTRLDDALLSYRALQVTAAVVIASALTDIAITLDAIYGSGTHAATVVAVANVFALLLLGGAASIASSGQSASGPEPEEHDREAPALAETTDEDATVARLVQTAMCEKKYYKDVDLNLTRLSRKLHLPARRISEAINRIHGKSVSQYVNEFRIEEACRLLGQTDMLISQIVFESGFQTKSNFNREFLRVTGVSPRQYRGNLSEGDAGPKVQAPGA